MAKSTFGNLPVKINDIIELDIESVAYDNSSIGRFKDFVIIVDRTVPGDKVKAQITTLKPNYARGKIIELISPSNERIDSHCKIFKVCGGCQWQFFTYEKQLEYKNILMQSFVKKLNLEDGVLKPIIGEKEHSWKYRNKVQYPVRTVESTGRLKAGYYEWNTNDLINIKHCPIQHEDFDEIIETIRELADKYGIRAYDAKKKTGWLRHIGVRYGVNTGEILVVFVAVSDNFKKSKDFTKDLVSKHKKIVGISLNINKGTTNVIYGPNTHTLYRRGYLFEEINKIKYKVSATSFFQVNTKAAERMLDIIFDLIGKEKNDIILDAYCGAGFFALQLAKLTRKMIGIEEVQDAIIDAKETAKINNINNIEFIFGKVENKVDDIFSKNKPNIVIVDPPRVGCNKKVIDAIIKIKPKKIIYVSCNPNTLIRDLEKLKEGNYKISSIQPIDMFPQTFHIENIVLLELH